ncbi:MAG: circularly permuted type 2 ATP-grasp protein [Myxococcales bacterium]|nr:circularly permuted type 2 ATP-grasp protein [Myxococcales bacterium]
MAMHSYDPTGFYDEMFEAPGVPRLGCELLVRRLSALPPEELQRRQRAAEQALLAMGITFNVYGSDAGTERIFPFDLIPRVVEAADWARIDAGLQQRIRALNAFIDDVYHERRCVRDGVVPAFVIETSKGLRPQCQGLDPPLGAWCHITGTDLVRGADGTFYVLEDNLRCPSGVSYVLENRRVMKRTFPQVFEQTRVRPVDAYPSRLREMLERLAPAGGTAPTVVLLTPGIYNSAYFEHAFLAQQMGIELVEGRDLVVRDDVVTMRTTSGFQRVDVVYRRIDDDFLDPLAFRSDSMLGVPGLFDAWRRGKVGLANAPGTGVADDKVIYTYVPDLVRYYLSAEPILPNVPTFVCWEPTQRAQVLANLDQYVVKAANESGGYGMLIGPHATPAERAGFAQRIQANPRNYIAQPTVQLSRVPTLLARDDGSLAIEGRHVDLRPYVLFAQDAYVLPGGLTRVALRKGSLVVNSSQGGGSKDTWVLAGPTLPTPGAPC